MYDVGISSQFSVVHITITSLNVLTGLGVPPPLPSKSTNSTCSRTYIEIVLTLCYMLQPFKNVAQFTPCYRGCQPTAVSLCHLPRHHLGAAVAVTEGHLLHQSAGQGRVGAIEDVPRPPPCSARTGSSRARWPRCPRACPPPPPVRSSWP